MQSLIRHLAMLSVLSLLMATQAAWGGPDDRSRNNNDPGAAIRDNIRSQMHRNFGDFNTDPLGLRRYESRNFTFNQRPFDWNGPWGQTTDRSRRWGPTHGYVRHYVPNNNFRQHGHRNFGFHYGYSSGNHNFGANFGTYYVPSGNYYYYGADPSFYYSSPSLRFSYGTTYAPWNYPQPVYTAPSNPRYGYYGYDYYGYGQEQYSAAPPVTYNDNRTYNYYGGLPETQQPGMAAPGAPAGTGQENVKIAPPAAETVIAPQTGFGARFYDQTRIDTPQGILAARFDGSTLVVGAGSSNERALSREADPAFGAIALYVPGEGVALIFREGDKIMAAYPTEGGKWWFEPLPYTVDFSKQVNLGMVGGTPWVVFDTPNGARFVVSFTGRHWQEVGSGTR